MAITIRKEDGPIKLGSNLGGIMTVELKWSSPTDVDLACMYELQDGTKKVIQALDKDFGSLGSSPFIMLSGDDRSGGSEKISINLSQMDKLKRALIFAFIYQGSNWGSVGDAKVYVNHPQQGEYVIELGNQSTVGYERASKTCALLWLENTDGELKLKREETYFMGYHEQVDRHFGWPSLNWTPGAK